MSSRDVSRLETDLARLGEEYRTVSTIAMRLARELDPSTLLPAIVTQARQLTRSEAGTLYVRRGENLAFAVAQNDLLDRDRDGAIDDLPSFELPIDSRSLAGLAAVEKRTLNIPDVTAHPAYSRSSSARFRYDVRSMLVVPLIEPDGDVLGVLQLMNARDEQDGPAAYGERAADLCAVLASHAATALVIANLYAEQQQVFDSLVGYTAAAIDARDPCTAGHSSRVATCSVAIAREMGGFSDVELRELRFAGIFHDVGKIGVRECVLTKSDKIEPEGMATIDARYAAACEAAIARAWEASDGAGRPREIAAAEIASLQEDLALLHRAKNPGWLSDEDRDRLQEAASRTWRDHQGRTHALIRPDELEKLQVRRGTLTEQERHEIQAHVQMSWDFLSKLPFPKDLERVPELAWSHHERMDGSGYPRGLRGEQILPGARILSVADVWDALTAEDRPYKKAMSGARALQVIEHEAEAGAFDGPVVDALGRLVRSGRIAQAVVGGDEPAFDAVRDVWR